MPRLISKNSHLNYFLNPYRVCVLSFVLFLFITFCCYALQIENPKYAWQVSVTLTLFYAMSVSVLHTISDDLKVSWQKSIIGYFAYIIPSQLVAWGVSGISFGELGTFRMIYIVVTICFIIFMVIATAVRQLVEFTEAKDREKERRERIKKNQQNRRL